jgi:hypothetical protein
VLDGVEADLARQRRAVLGLGDLPAHRRPMRPTAVRPGRCAASSSRSCAATPARRRATSTPAGIARNLLQGVGSAVDVRRRQGRAADHNHAEPAP